jgi:hypothetical protein
MAWFALLAQFSNDSISDERRSAVRRRLAFESLLTILPQLPKVIVLDLSEAGMMIHAREELEVGELFEVALPEAGGVEARVVWKRTMLYGCKFLTPISRGTISAILLRSGPSGGTDR